MALRHVRRAARAGRWCLAVVVAWLVLSVGWIARVSAMPAVFPGTHWKEASPESRGLDPVRLQAAIEFLKTNAPGDGVDELVIVRHGVLVWRGPAVDRVHGTWSCTKSFVSTVLGLLVDDGKARLDAKVATVLPSLAATYPDVTFRHLTTMTSGYRAEGDTPLGSYRWGPSPTPFAPSVTPLFTPPGSKYTYWDSSMNQLAHALTRIAGEPIAGLFKRRIADPIGIDAMRWYWPAFDTQDGLVVNGGAGNHEADVHISARDLARLGLLYVNRGRWNDRQLLSTAWVEAATRPQVPASLPLGDPVASPANGAGVYGFNWWTNGVRSNGQPLWPGVPSSAFAASGWNNNRLFVIPDWDMVVVRLGQDQTKGFAITGATWAEFLRRLGAALVTREVAPRE
jgi:CubicO group peptidase (beta-lactamase class C family)